MHYAISIKVLGQTHMWYTQRQAIKLFEDFSIFMGFWILNTLKNKTKNVRSITLKKKKKIVKEICYKQKTMHDMMHEPMILSIGNIDAWT